MNKKICHISSVHSALDARIFYRECKQLAKNGYEVTLIANNHNKHEIIDNVNIISFPKTNSRLFRMLILSFYMFYKALIQKSDLYQFHDPELMLVGLLLKLSGKNVVYDVHEDLPKQIYNKPYIPRKLKPIISNNIKKIEAYVSKKMNGIVAVVPTIKDRFMETNANTTMFRNFPEFDLVKNIDPVFKKTNKFVIIYPGSLSQVRGIMISLMP